MQDLDVALVVENSALSVSGGLLSYVCHTQAVSGHLSCFTFVHPV